MSVSRFSIVTVVSMTMLQLPASALSLRAEGPPLTPRDIARVHADSTSSGFSVASWETFSPEEKAILERSRPQLGPSLTVDWRDADESGKFWDRIAGWRGRQADKPEYERHRNEIYLGYCELLHLSRAAAAAPRRIPDAIYREWCRFLEEEENAIAKDLENKRWDTLNHRYVSKKYYVTEDTPLYHEMIKAGALPMSTVEEGTPLYFEGEEIVGTPTSRVLMTIARVIVFPQMENRVALANRKYPRATNLFQFPDFKEMVNDFSSSMKQILHPETLVSIVARGPKGERGSEQFDTDSDWSTLPVTERVNCLSKDEVATRIHFRRLVIEALLQGGMSRLYAEDASRYGPILTETDLHALHQAWLKFGKLEKLKRKNKSSNRGEEVWWSNIVQEWTTSRERKAYRLHPYETHYYEHHLQGSQPESLEETEMRQAESFEEYLVAEFGVEKDGTQIAIASLLYAIHKSAEKSQPRRNFRRSRSGMFLDFVPEEQD